MALLTLQDASAGAALTFTAASGGGDTIQAGTEGANWSLGVVLIVRNDAVGAMNVTVEGAPALSVPAGGEAVIPVHGGIYYKTVKSITYSAVTSVTVAAARLSTAK